MVCGRRKRGGSICQLQSSTRASPTRRSPWSFRSRSVWRTPSARAALAATSASARPWRPASGAPTAAARRTCPASPSATWRRTAPCATPRRTARTASSSTSAASRPTRPAPAARSSWPTAAPSGTSSRWRAAAPRPAQVERTGATHIGNFCERRWTAEKYIIRSLAVGDENNDGVVDYADYRCIYFPDTVGGIPEMVPAAPTPDGVWLGAGGDADVDANGDKECGISLLGFESGEEMNAALKMAGSADLELTQEKALIINKQAVIRLIRLPDF